MVIGANVRLLPVHRDQLYRGALVLFRRRRRRDRSAPKAVSDLPACDLVERCRRKVSRTTPSPTLSLSDLPPSVAPDTASSQMSDLRLLSFESVTRSCWSRTVPRVFSKRSSTAPD